MNIRSIVASVLGGIVLTIPSASGWTVCGTVRSEDGTLLSGAFVRVKGSASSVTTSELGTFCLTVDERISRPVRVVAWADGYYIGGTNVRGNDAAGLTLKSWRAGDNPRYQWLSPRIQRSAVKEYLIRSVLDISARILPTKAFAAFATRHFDIGCRDCHRACYAEWAASAHARGVHNERFNTMYYGTDVAGHRGLLTRHVFNRDYGWRPLLPDPTQRQVGPGYKLDFPHTSGNCAACHLPAAAVGAPLDTDPSTTREIERQGVSCDVCHKISGVVLDARTGLPPEGRPGVMSIEFSRPRPDRQTFLGPLQDVDAGVDSFLPLMKQSEICAPCHQASFWGTPVYESFAEWKSSRYAARGVTCQSCHMRSTGSMINVAPSRGGINRDPKLLAAHDFAGSADGVLLRDAAALDVTTSIDPNGAVDVKVSVTNKTAGHDFPTDSPLRHLILVVRARADNRELKLLDGPILPAWCGTGDFADGNYGGYAGKAFAKVLMESWTGAVPTAAYWNPTRVVSDNRLAPEATDTSVYRFERSGAGAVDVQVDLIYRRAFKELIEQKGWNLPDIVLSTKKCEVN